MAIDKEVEAVLRQRADKLAIRRKVTLSREKTYSVSVVKAGSEQFGIPTEFLACIVKSPPIATMPELPAWLPGIAQIRGELVGVVNLAKWFGVPQSSTASFLAVVEKSHRKIGLVIDSVTGFREIGESDIAENFSGASEEGHPIRMTTRDLVTVLDIPKLFESPDIQSSGKLANTPVATARILTELPSSDKGSGGKP